MGTGSLSRTVAAVVAGLLLVTAGAVVGRATAGPGSGAPLAVRLTTLGDAPVSDLADAAVAWTGDEYVVLGGVAGTEKFGADGEPETPDDEPLGGEAMLAFALDPASGTWRELSAPPLAPRSRATAVWTGREVVVWGGTARRNGVGGLLDGAAWDPTTDTWRELPDAPAGTDRSFGQAVVSDGSVVIGAGSAPDSQGDATLLVLDLATDTWSTVPGTGPVLQLLDLEDGTIAVLRGRVDLDDPGHRVEVVTADGEPLAELVDLDEPTRGAEAADDEFPMTAGLVGGRDGVWLVLDPANAPARAYDLRAEEPAEVALRADGLHGTVHVAGIGERRPVLRLGGASASFFPDVAVTERAVALDVGTGATVGIAGERPDDDGARVRCGNGGAWAAGPEGEVLLVGGECDPVLAHLVLGPIAVAAG